MYIFVLSVSYSDANGACFVVLSMSDQVVKGNGVINFFVSEFIILLITEVFQAHFLNHSMDSEMNRVGISAPLLRHWPSLFLGLLRQLLGQQQLLIVS